jgi:hypothetical protein
MRMFNTKEEAARLNPLPALLVGLVLTGSALLLPGCDLAEEESLGRLPGSWQVTRLSVDGTPVTGQLNVQYDRLVLTLRRDAGGRDFFSLVGRRQGENRILTVQGTFDKDGRELTLKPNSLVGFIEVDYTISDSTSPDSTGSNSTAPVLELHAEEGRSEDALLDLIQFPIQGTVDQVRLHLSKE